MGSSRVRKKYLTFRKKKIKIESKWELVKLSELVEILDGQRIPVSQNERQNGEYPYYGATGIVDFVDKYIFDEQLVLLGEDGAKWGANENSAFIVQGKYWVNNHAHVFRPVRDKIMDKYLVDILNKMDLSEYITGLNVLKLNQANLKQIQIPLPPLDIQEQIVREMEKVEKREEQMKNGIESGKKSIAELFQSNQRVHLKSFLQDINPSKSAIISGLADDTEVGFLSMPDVSNDGIIINLQIRQLRDVKSGFTFFQENDVLLAKITPCMENGKGALVPKIVNNIGFGSTEFFVLRSDMTKLQPKILFYFIQDSMFRMEAEKSMTGASGHRRVSKEFVENYLVPDISPSEQSRIVGEIEKIEAEIVRLESELVSIPTQKEAILKKYLL